MKAEGGGGEDGVVEGIVEGIACGAGYVYGGGGWEGCGDAGRHQERVGEAVGAGANEGGGEEFGVALR